MKSTLLLFFGENGVTLSWRKTGTAICYLIFAIACIGYLITHGFNELPSAYLAIIGTVFAFYFFKNTVKDLKITNKNNENEKQPS